VLFAYVFLFDTRNGIGLATILFLIAATMVFLPIILSRKKQIKNTDNGGKKTGAMVRVSGSIVLILILALGTYFAYRQTQMNSGWINTIEDAKIAVQIDRYPNWQNPSVMGYPKTDSGRVVTVNTYERLAWAVAAMHLIAEHPLGNGVLHYSFKRSLEKKYPNTALNPNAASASHSAWLDLGLTLGLPGLLLLIGSLFLLLYRFWVNPSPLGKTGFMLCTALLLLYIVAELIGQHGLESLFFWIALLSGLQYWVASHTQGLSTSRKIERQ
jgi:O-antigen ligase